MEFSKSENNIIERSPLKFNKLSQSLSQYEIQNSDQVFTYGQQVEIVTQKGKLQKTTFFQLDDSPCYLYWIDKSKQEESKLRLTDIINIDDMPSKKEQRVKNRNFICLTLKNQEDNEIVVAFENIKDQKIWQHAFKTIFKRANEIEQEEKMQDDFKHMAQNIFNKADEDGSRSLDYKETEMLLKSLHIKFNRNYMFEIFKKFDEDGSGTIELNEFKNILKDLMKKEELKGVYSQYCQDIKKSQTSQRNSFNESQMTIDCLQNFLEQEQDHKLEKEDIEENMKIRSLPQNPQNGNMQIDFYQFTNFIFNIENSIFNPNYENLYQNMCRPLSDYYIASSHNTYLSADQLVGDSDINCYKRVLLKGCRCVELDTWDGPKEPIITHGHTLTSKIKLIDVLKTIEKYAFQRSPYPVILSFENHCSKAQTKIIAQQCKQVFGKQLYTLPLNYDSFEYFKSPHSLKYKIIIKSKSKIDRVTEFNEQDLAHKQFTDTELFVKRTQSQQSSNRNIQVRQTERQDSKFKNQNGRGRFQQDLDSNRQLQYSARRNASIESYCTYFQDQDNPFSHGFKKQRELQFMQNYDNMIGQLSIQDLDDASGLQNMLVIKDDSDIGEDDEDEEGNAICDAEIVNVTTMFGTKMKDCKDERSCFHISSIDEDKTEKFAYNKDKEKQKDIIEFHKKYFTRVYPKGTRVDSSNYNPITGFSIGSQVVALNYQTLDQNMMIYLSKFQQNGGVESGYVLKPEWQRSDCKPENQKYLYDFDKPVKNIQIQVISGQSLEYQDSLNDKRNFISPYVKVEVRGIPIDEKQNQAIRTKTVVKNNLDPLFEQKGEFNISCPDLAYLIFQVHDDNNGSKLISWYALPLECVRKGYRVVPLYNNKGNLIEHSYILVKIQINDI